MESQEVASPVGSVEGLKESLESFAQKLDVLQSLTLDISEGIGKLSRFVRNLEEHRLLLLLADRSSR